MINYILYRYNIKKSGNGRHTASFKLLAYNIDYRQNMFGRYVIDNMSMRGVIHFIRTGMRLNKYNDTIVILLIGDLGCISVEYALTTRNIKRINDNLGRVGKRVILRQLKI